MYATLRNNQLITPGHDGTQSVVDVDGPGVYEVRTCRERGRVVEFGSGSVEVTASDLRIAATLPWRMAITDHTPMVIVDYPNITFLENTLDHKVEILTPATT